MWLPALAAGGAVLAAGPIIIHILFRRRYRVVDFAAMRFLLDSLRRSKQRLRLEEIIIIALRCLACLLIGLTLANIRAAASIVPGSHTATAHVFLLDDSLSMGQQIGAATIFQKAVARLADNIRSMNDQDLVAVISASQPESGKPLGTLALARELKRDNFADRLAALRPTDLRARFPDALSAARTLIQTQQQLPIRVYLVSDFRRSDFAEPQSVDALRKAATSLPSKVELVCLDYGVPCKNNLTVEKLELLDKLAVAKVGTQFQVAVRNNGSAPVDGATVTVTAGDITLPVIPLGSIAPGETIRKTFRYVLPTPGVAALKASVTGDALPGDDSASLALAVYDNLRILIVDGSTNPTSTTSGSYCIAHALDPSEQAAFGQRVEVVDAASVNEADFERYDVVLLTNVREFPSASDGQGHTIVPVLQGLEKFVRSGGGVGIFFGPNINPEFYNGPLFNGGSGISPLKISPAAVPTPDPKVFNRLRPDSIAKDPMLRLFAANGEKFTQLVRFFGFHRATEQAAPLAQDAGGVTVLARFDDKDGSPALVRRTLGRGTVIACYTLPDTKWTDWPKDLSFLPVINDMAWSLARSRGEDLTAPVGQRIAYTIPATLSDATSIMLKTPAYPAEDVQLIKPHLDGSSKIAEFLSPTHAGVYQFDFTLPDRSTRTVFFARTIDPAEGETAKVDEKELASALGRSFDYHGNLAIENPKVVAAPPSQSYFWIFLGALLGVLGLEVFLAQRFGHYAAQQDRHAAHPYVHPSSAPIGGRV